MRKAMLLLAVVGLVGLAWAADPFVGTWKMDVAKSKFNPGPAAKSITCKIVPEGEGFKWITDWIAGDGKAYRLEWSGKFDGKDYPATGDPNADTYALKKIDSNTIVEVDKKVGKAVGNWRMVISKDGRTSSWTGKFKDEKGQEINVTLVFDMQ